MARRRLYPFVRRKLAKRLRELHGDACWLCRLPLAFDPDTHALGRTTIDHLMPVSKGGPDSLWNLRLAHQTCNEARADSTKEDEIAYRFSKLFVDGVPISLPERRILEKKREIGRNALPRPGIDENQFEDFAPEPDRFGRLDIHDGRIHFSLYRQNGTMQPMDLPRHTRQPDLRRLDAGARPLHGGWNPPPDAMIRRSAVPRGARGHDI